MKADTLLAEDLQYILQATQPVWRELRGKTIFITGGTGFIGSWFLETLLFANRVLDLQLRLLVLTRDPVRFADKAPHLASDPATTFLSGDIRNFVYPEISNPYIIHAATEASATLNKENPQAMLDTIIQGTRRTLDFYSQAKAAKMLLLSSGAVYGKQPTDMPLLDECYKGKLDNLDENAAYAVGKHTAEHMCVVQAKQHGADIKIARCFAFVGPYLPLDRHFAIGNFIRDALAGSSIKVNSDGSSYRSYLYASDMVIWLLHILCFGETAVPYNVGSSEPVSILELAGRVAKQVTPEAEITVAMPVKSNIAAERYIPSVSRAKAFFGFNSMVSLDDAIHKTIQWNKHR